VTALAVLDTGRRLAWLTPPLAVLVVAAVTLLRRRTPMIPLADGASYEVSARRTASVRVLLATLLVVLLALGVALLARDGAPVAQAAPPHTGTILVLDLSGSVQSSGSHVVFDTLGRVMSGAAGAHAGLVLFSDVAEEALPPATPTSELRPIRAFFAPQRPAKSGSSVAAQPQQSPWDDGFSGGTMISTGLAAARAAVHRDGLAHANVVLISDLADDPNDWRALKRELWTDARDPTVKLQVVPVPGTSTYGANVFRRFLGADALRPHLQPWKARTHGAAGLAGELPIGFVLLAIVLAVALVANELLAPALDWRGRSAEAEA
jgi:hypothetical protein